MNLDFGISTMVYYHEHIEKLLPFLMDWGIRTIEIRPRKGHFELKDPDSIDYLKKKIDHYKILVKAIHMPMNEVDISHPEEYDRVKSIREVQKTVIAAHRLGAELVIVHPGGMCHKLSEREKRLSKCIKSLTEIVDFCCQWNIKLAIENSLPGRLGDQWEEIQQIISAISSENVGICLDTGHYLLNQQHTDIGELNLDKEPINWQKELLHIHIHDNNGKDDLHLLPGDGCFPWALLVSYLKKIQYHGALILEPKERSQLPPYLDKINQVMEKLKTYAY
jgi:sugar phosphate isomerase/epimerase